MDSLWERAGRDERIDIPLIANDLAEAVEHAIVGLLADTSARLKLAILMSVCLN